MIELYDLNIETSYSYQFIVKIENGWKNKLKKYLKKECNITNPIRYIEYAQKTKYAIIVVNIEEDSVIVVVNDAKEIVEKLKKELDTIIDFICEEEQSA